MAKHNPGIKVQTLQLSMADEGLGLPNFYWHYSAAQLQFWIPCFNYNKTLLSFRAKSFPALHFLLTETALCLYGILGNHKIIEVAPLQRGLQKGPLRSLAQPVAQSRTITSTRWPWPELCLAESWSLRRWRSNRLCHIAEGNLEFMLDNTFKRTWRRGKIISFPQSLCLEWGSFTALSTQSCHRG